MGGEAPGSAIHSTVPAPGSVVGGCRIIRELGRGGMGVVFLAEEEALGRKVALKLISPQLAEDVSFRSRFARESRLAAAIDHPNAVPVYSAGEEDGLLFLSMRYVTGTDLHAALTAEGRLSPTRAARIVCQVGSALDAAHVNGLVHRDVKPANVLLSGSGADEHAYLSDFGLTKHTSSQSAMTETGHWIGTLDYAAPEQLETGAIDARADVYSLGCVLFEMLAGQVPYQGTYPQKMWGHVNSSVPSLAAHAPELSERFDPVLQRAMAKSPDDRFQSAGDLGRAALAAVEGLAVTEPERRVATGTAAPSTAELPPQRPPTPVGATLMDSHAPRPTPAPSPQTVRASRRPTWLAPVVALVAVALAAGALLGTGVLGGGSDDSDPQPAASRSDERAGRTREPEPRRSPRTEKRDPRPAAPATTPPAKPAVASLPAFEPYTSLDGAYSTVVPTGDGWSVGDAVNQNPPDQNPRYRLEIYGPGVVIWIDTTPMDTATGPTSGVISSTTVPHDAFGSMDVYTFRSSSSPCTSRCVDYVMQSGESSGHAVLAGGTDFALASRVAKRIAGALEYYDV